VSRLITAISAEDYQRRTTEAQMETTIRDLVNLNGGRLFHLRDARQAPELEDMPDLIVLTPGHAAIVETKSQKRRTTTGQRQVMELLSGPIAFFGGIVRPVPRDGERSFDEFLEWLKGEGS
jgi:hypothetical protein